MSSANRNLQKSTIAITTGDADGIGLEVTLKALAKIKNPGKFKYIIYKDRTPKKLQNLERLMLKNLNSRQIDICESHTSPALWVVDAAKKCLNNEYAALVTGPLSKETIIASGMNFVGHTEILKHLSSSRELFMSFLGKNFNVVLATGHIPISAVPKALSYNKLCSALLCANNLRKILSTQNSKRPIAVLGLNPHAGENGIIGREELALFKKIHLFAKANKIPISGPLVPDAAFLKQNWFKFSIYVSLYHDQGLIPFKLVHGHSSGTHLTLGLPFIRTSVDHGTAKDIYLKNKADCGSMLEALIWAKQLALRSKNGI